MEINSKELRGRIMTKEEEYKKDINEIKKEILKEGDTLVTKRALLERFCKIDEEYNGRPWNLLQILANISILIGQEPSIKKKGKWEFIGYGCYACSECGEVYTVRQFEAINNHRDNIFPNGCPNCATEMEN